MGFRQEINEEHERQERERKERQFKLKAIQEYCSRKNIDAPSAEECDKIIYPEDYNEWGNKKHMTW